MPLTMTTASATVTHLVQALLAPPGRQTQTQVQYKAALAQYHVKRRQQQQQAAGSVAPPTDQLRTPGQPLGTAAAEMTSLPMSQQQQQQQQQPSPATATHVPSTPAAGAQLSIFQRAADLTVPEALPACSDHSDAGAAAAVPAASASSGSQPADGLGLVSMAYGSDGDGDGNDGSGVMDAQSGHPEHDTPTSAAAAPLTPLLAAGGAHTTPPAEPAPPPGTVTAAAEGAAAPPGTATAAAEGAAERDGSCDRNTAAGVLELPCGEAGAPHAAADADGDSHVPEAAAAEAAAAATPAPLPISSMLATSQPAIGGLATDASAPAAMDTDSGATAAEDCSPAHGGCSGGDELPLTAAPEGFAGSTGAEAPGGTSTEAPGGGGEAADGVPKAVDGAALPPPSTPASAGLTMPDSQPQLFGEPKTADSEAAADDSLQLVPASEAAAAAPESTEAAAAAPSHTDELQQLVPGPEVDNSGPVAEAPDVAAAFARGDRKKLLRMLLDLPLGPSPREVILVPLPAMLHVSVPCTSVSGMTTRARRQAQGRIGTSQEAGGNYAAISSFITCPF